MPLPAAPPLAAADYDGPVDRAARRRQRAVVRAATRSRWWWGPAVAAIALLGVWGVLRADQFLGGVLVWPRQGARFVEISGALPVAPVPTGGSITVVVSGLNTKSGTAVASALLPAMTADGGRVFSLVYGSGITDEDLIAKYDALIAEVRPREVTFFGSSMGGDVALNLAAHAHLIHAQQVAAPAPVAPGDPDRAGVTVPVTDPVGALGSWWPWRPASDPADPAGTRGMTAGRQGDPSADTPGGTVGGPTPPVAAPRVVTVYLDCSPLGADDVRDRSRTSADLLTALTEAAGTDGGAATRVAVEVLIQRRQWSAGLLPTPLVRWNELAFKYRQVIREKISSPGISTSLVKDQYGVIRRMDAAARFAELAEGPAAVSVVYFRPVDASADTVVAVERVTRELGRLAAGTGVEIRLVGVEGGQHASAQTDPSTYLTAIDDPRPGTRLGTGPADVIMLATEPR